MTFTGDVTAVERRCRFATRASKMNLLDIQFSADLVLPVSAATALRLHLMSGLS